MKNSNPKSLVFKSILFWITFAIVAVLGSILGVIRFLLMSIWEISTEVVSVLDDSFSDNATTYEND